MARRTKAEAQETREQILDAAEQVFHRLGVSATALNDIAQQAGVTRGAIYWHFKNKYDVFIAMVERHHMGHDQLFLAAGSDDEQDPLGRLREILLGQIGELQRDESRRRVFEICFLRCEYTAETLPLLSHRQDGFARFSTALTRVFQRAMALGQLPQDLSVRCAVTQLHAQLVGLLFSWVVRPDFFDLSEHAEVLVDTFLFLLRESPELRRPALACAEV
ncbi:TetR family transcriptional regulator [Isoalcanivorax beigongshangi]|uniref:TetR family transcriptional regulator n=1 Tax=Isoalcanivorax beigongshangi TaxID=3238810 RepID=A0ABV4AHS2_9GAMM